MPTSRIQQEIRQTRPFQSAGQEAVVSLLRTASVVRRAFEHLMLEHGLTFQQYNVLRILRGAGEPLPTMEVRARMIEPEPGITRLIGRMERKNLVRRVKGKNDGRVKLCTITRKGRHLLSRLDEPVRRMDDEVLGSLSERQLRSLMRLLDAIRHS